MQRAGRRYLVNRNGSGAVGNDNVVSISLSLDALDSGAGEILTGDESAQRVALEQRRHDTEREEDRSRWVTREDTRVNEQCA